MGARKREGGGGREGSKRAREGWSSEGMVPRVGEKLEIRAALCSEA